MPIEPNPPEGTIFLRHPHAMGEFKLIKVQKGWLLVAEFQCATLGGARKKIDELEKFADKLDGKPGRIDLV